MRPGPHHPPLVRDTEGEQGQPSSPPLPTTLSSPSVTASDLGQHAYISLGPNSLSLSPTTPLPVLPFQAGADAHPLSREHRNRPASSYPKIRPQELSAVVIAMVNAPEKPITRALRLNAVPSQDAALCSEPESAPVLWLCSTSASRLSSYF